MSDAISVSLVDDKDPSRKAEVDQYGHIKMALHDGSGNAIGSLSGAMNIHDADVHTEPVNHYFYRTLLSYTLTGNVASQATSFTVTDATGLAAGDFLHITDSSTGNHEHDLPIITNVAVNTITLNRPLDKAYLAASTTIHEVSPNMNVSGTLASPVTFIVLPSPNEVWHETSLDFTMTDQTAMDDAKFGGLTALTNGVILRLYNPTTSEYETIMTIRSNSGFSRNGFETKYTDHAPAGFYGFSGHLDVEGKYHAIFRITNAAENIQLQILIQDDLTGLDTFEMKTHGHIEGA